MLLVAACMMALAGTLRAQPTGQGSSVTLRPTDTGRSITTGRGVARAEVNQRQRAGTQARTRTPRVASGMPGVRSMPGMLAVKTNLVYAAALQTPNLAVEYSWGGRSSVELSAGYNNWGKLWGDKATTGPAYDPANHYKRRLNHIFIKGEYRYWFREPFDGFFAGGDLFWSKYRTGELKMLGIFQDGFDYFGQLVGGSVTGGWMWRWSRRWATEFSLGRGMAVMRHDQGTITSDDTTFTVANPLGVNKTYWGPTSVGIKMVFMIR